MSWDSQSRYRLLLQINTAIVKYTNRDQLFQALARELGKIYPFDRFSINLYDSETKSLRYFSAAAGVLPEGISEESRPLEKGAIAQEVIRTKKPVIIPDLRDRSYWSSVRAMLEAGLASSLAFPLITRNQVLGSIHFSFRERPANLTELADFLAELSDVVAIAVENMLAYTRLNELNQSLKEQKNFLLENDDAFSPGSFFYVSPAMRDIMRQVELIASTDASVLITGETGTGKDFVAHHIHRLSPRREALFVKVNCPPSPQPLRERALGHAKGLHGAT